MTRNAIIVHLGIVLMLVACNSGTTRVVETATDKQFYTATVDHSRSWADLETKIDYVNPDFTDKHFPSEPGGTGQVVLTQLKLHSDGEDLISTDEVLKRINAQGMRPATAREARAYALANPKFQTQFPIVALGSQWDDGRDGMPAKPYLCGQNDGPTEAMDYNCSQKQRALVLDYSEHYWTSGWRFLAARK